MTTTIQPTTEPADTTGSAPPRRCPPDDADLSSVPTERLEHEMLTLAGHLAAATCSFLMMVGEYDRRRSWESWECLSCAHWLNWRCGVGMTAAREQVRVARRLQELPLVRATFARGELSYSKVRAITRVAHPAIEAKLVDLARWSTASQLEQACAALRRCTDPAQAEKHLQEEEDRAELRRSLSWSTDPESGDLVVRLRIPAGVAAESFRTSVDALADVRANGRSDGQSDTEQAQPVALECRRLDALMDLVSAGATSDTSLAPRAEVVVHVTAHEAGSPHSTGHRWPVVTQRGQQLPWSTLEQLACDAGVRSVLDIVRGGIDRADADAPDASLRPDLLTSLDLGRHRRFPSPALRRAVARRDRGCCRFPGCDRRHRLHVHHIVWWEQGGRTDLANLLLLCPKHHRAVHRDQWSLTGTATHPEFRRREHLVASAAPPLQGRLAELVDRHHRHGLEIAADGAGSHWQGDHIDWDCFFAAFVSFDPGPTDASAEDLDPLVPGSPRLPGG